MGSKNEVDVQLWGKARSGRSKALKSAVGDGASNEKFVGTSSGTGAGVESALWGRRFTDIIRGGSVVGGRAGTSPGGGGGGGATVIKVEGGSAGNVSSTAGAIERKRLRA